MGAVYFAQHRLTGERLALKLIHSGGVDPKILLERFRREVSVASRIGHPGIVRVQDAGQEANGDIYVVMELLRGRDLHHYMHDEAFELRGGVFVLRSALEPLAAAHSAGIVHRDLKPQNIFLHKSQEGLQIKILDFGIARDLEAEEGLTATNVSLGTPQYISPEQATQARQVGPPADIWAIGVTLYQMIAGHPPFDGNTAFNVLRAACEEAPPELRPSTALGERLVTVVEACLRKAPDERPRDARQLAQMLDLAIGSSSASIATSPQAEATQAELSLEAPSRRRRWPLLLLLTLGLATAGAFLWRARAIQPGLPVAAPLPVSGPRPPPSSEGGQLQPIPVPSAAPRSEIEDGDEGPIEAEAKHRSSGSKEPQAEPASKRRRRPPSRRSSLTRRRRHKAQSIKELSPDVLTRPAPAPAEEPPAVVAPQDPLRRVDPAPMSPPDQPLTRSEPGQATDELRPLEEAASSTPPPDPKKVPRSAEEKKSDEAKDEDPKEKDKRPGFISF